MKTYEQQRKDRLQTIIDDYIQDETISSRQIFEEILSCINDVEDYHRKYQDRARYLKSFCIYKTSNPTADDLIDDMRQQYRKIPKRY